MRSFHRLFISGFIVALSAGFIPFSVASSKAIYSTVGEFVKSKSGAEIEGQAIGDLNGDGRADWVGSIVIQPPARAGRERGPGIRQLFILLRMPDGKYEFSSATPQIEKPGKGTASIQFGEFEIVGDTFSFSDRDSWQGCSTSYLYRFKLYEKEWRLIEARFQQISDIDGDNSKSLEITRNVITGEEQVHMSGRPNRKYKFPGKKIFFRDYNGDFPEAFRPARGIRSSTN